MRCEGSSCDEQWEHARGPLQLEVVAAPAGGGGSLRPPATRHRAKCPKKIVKLVRYKCGEVLLKMCNGPWQPVRTKSYAQDSVGTAPSMPSYHAGGRRHDVDASSADVFWRRAVPGAGAASALVMPRGRGLYFKSTRVLGSTRELVPESWATQAVGPCSFKTQLQAA